MRIFVAGAAGVVGRQLVPMLLSAGHQVTGTTRDRLRADWLRAAGAAPVELDVYDRAAVRSAIATARPDVVMHQLTDLAAGFGPEQLRANARLREAGTRHLVEAMTAAGVSRLVAQSVAWLYAPGTLPFTEDDPLRALAPGDLVLPGVLSLEQQALTTPGIDGIVLRYGYLYGPGTASTTRDASSADPHVHVADAARAAALAVEIGGTGIFNIVDDGGPVSNDLAGERLGWRPSSARGAGAE